MALLRCNKCALLTEQADTLAGQTIACPKCGTPVRIHSTLYFVEQLLTRYFDAQRELARLKTSAPDVAAEAPKPAPADEIDLSNTTVLASEQQHKPIHDWFQKRQIKAEAEPDNVDTSGFYDEVAEAIGANLPVLADVLERMRWSQHKGHASASIGLSDKSAEDARTISTFCQQLYDFSFVAKCLHNRQEKSIRLVLQTAPMIRAFFSGRWLEWHALMVCLRHAKERGWRVSCARSLRLTLGNGDPCEIDVFMLRDGATPVPICIECKTGEFRQDIDRYLALKKRLGLGRHQFVMCIAGLPDENAKAFTSMYELSFVNERTLVEHLARLS